MPAGYILCPKICTFKHELNGTQRIWCDLSLIIWLQSSFSYAELPSASEYRKYLDGHVELFFFFFNFFFKKLIYFNWRLITLQYCSGFCSFMSYIDMNQPWVYMCPPSWTLFTPPSPSHPSGSSQCTSPENPVHASNLDWWSVSHMIIHMFQCYSLISSHPHLLPQSPKDCSIRGSWFLIYQITLPFFLL